MPAQANKSKDTNLLPQLKSQYQKLDIDKFQALHQADWSSYELAAEFGISQNLAWRIKTKLSEVKQTLTHFKDNKLNYLSESQYHALALQSKIIEFYLQDCEFDKLNNKEKVMLLDSTNRIAGTLEDKQITIINVKGNLNVNSFNLSAEESTLLQSRAIDLVSQHRSIPMQAIEIEAQAQDATEIDPD